MFHKGGIFINIGKTIADRRKELGLTQQALAKKLNVSFQAVSKWENGTFCPDVNILPSLAATLIVCCCLVTLLGISIWQGGTQPLSPNTNEQLSNHEIANNPADTIIDNNKIEVSTISWLSADEVLKSAETGTQMGVAVPMLVAYQGAIYGFTAEEYNENSQYALLENEVTLRKNYSYPAYQVKEVSDNVAIVLNGRLEIYQKLFEVKAVIDGNPYRVVQPMMSGIDYSYGEIIQENEDFTVYQAINAQSGEAMEAEYAINILPLLKRELPNFFGGDENYGDAWWVAVEVPQTDN